MSKRTPSCVGKRPGCPAKIDAPIIAFCLGIARQLFLFALTSTTMAGLSISHLTWCLAGDLSMPADAMASRSMFWAAKADLRVVARHTGYGGRNIIAGVACSADPLPGFRKRRSCDEPLAARKVHNRERNPARPLVRPDRIQRHLRVFPRQVHV